MKIYDKPQHIFVPGTELRTQIIFDREAFFTVVAAVGIELPALVVSAVNQGRFDNDPMLLSSVVGDLGPRVLAGEFHHEVPYEADIGRWEWVDALDPRVDPDIRSRAAEERAAKGLAEVEA